MKEGLLNLSGQLGHTRAHTRAHTHTQSNHFIVCISYFFGESGTGSFAHARVRALQLSNTPSILSSISYIGDLN